MEKVIEAKKINKVYGLYSNVPKIAIDDISLDVYEGDFICIMGPSGSGKTTLINILATIDDLTKGQLVLLGNNILGLFEKEKALLRKKDIGFIFQNYNLIDTLKNKDNILFSLRLNKVPVAKQDQLLQDIVRKLNIEDIIDKFPYECSGGQQQRVAIARALVTNPKILFADEPTGNIDSLSSRQLMDLFVKINREFKTTIVMVSHDSFVASFSNTLYYIVDGKVETKLERKALSQFDYYTKIAKITTQIDYFK
ncbi:ABC transporter ATP-binding protein [uncultured Thomasclavelia sp.]|uniref:ABC transporter ATP-binding protein n=1 Tax=uncultured Thomasclavelia sp. TaxID=3025759 RepID=UPI0025F8370B|nr:ABC transporter ATP-binding protein [uncultured Thomasclavelia sp.]